jgi:hypothetical protein
MRSAVQKWLLRALYGALVMLPIGAIANYAATVGSGTNFGSVVISGVHFASQLLCDATTANQCAAVSAAGAVKVDGSAVTQPVSLPTWAGGTLGAMANYGTSPGAVLVPGVNSFITNTPTVNQGTSPWVANVSTWAGGTLGGMANYGTSPGSVLVPGVNAFITNANANGQNTMANSAPIAIASNQSAIPTNPQAAGTGGCTAQTILSAASNNATVIGSAAAHTLCWVRWENSTTTLMDIRAYDTATAPAGGAPCNSATNVVMNDVAQSNATSPGGVANLGPFGQAFANGIVICITGANANNDNTNATTGLNLNIGFK